MSWHTVKLLAYGFLAGTAGVKVLSSQDAKTAYTHVTAAAMRCVDDVVKTATVIKENCDDIAADAKAINDKRAAEARAREIADAKALLAEVEGT